MNIAGTGEGKARPKGSLAKGQAVNDRPYLIGTDLTSVETSEVDQSVGATAVDDSEIAAAFGISLVSTAAELDSLSAECGDLAGHCLEANIFYEPWMLAAALNCFPLQEVIIVVVRHPRHGVTGIFPFQLERKFRGLPLRCLKSLRHQYCFLCTPLVATAHARATVRAFLEWVESNAASAPMIELDLVANDGPFWKLWMSEVAARARWSVHTISYQRAQFMPSQGGEPGISGKHLKEFRRLKRRLAERGVCTYRALRSDELIEPWINGFLLLEASGWKGRGHTALASDNSSRRFFMTVVTEAAARNRIQMLAIEMDGVPIAMKCNFLAMDGAFAFKIAYDERYEKYSPGVLLELFNMSNLINNCAQIKWIDSCATPQHFMINRLWSGRRAVVTGLMASHGIAAFMVRHWHLFHQARRLFMSWRKKAV